MVDPRLQREKDIVKHHSVRVNEVIGKLCQLTGGLLLNSQDAPQGLAKEILWFRGS